MYIAQRISLTHLFPQQVTSVSYSSAEFFCADTSQDFLINKNGNMLHVPTIPYFFYILYPENIL